MDTTNVFSVEPSPCCAHRVRVRLGNKHLCLSWREAANASRALKQMANRAKNEEPRENLGDNKKFRAHIKSIFARNGQ